MKKGQVLFFLSVLLTMLPAYAVLAKEMKVTGEKSTGELTQQENNSIAGQWIGEEMEWQYQLPDGTFLSKSWLYEQGHWYYLGNDGWMLTGKRKIGSDYYYFLDDGVMATGWIYNENEEVWHYAEESGRLKKGWHRGGDAWYWFNSKYEMFSGGNRMIDAHKYYFYENGQLAANQYAGLFYYDENGNRNRSYDIVVKGKRKPEEEEKAQLTKVMAELPRTWIQRFLEDGWELMYYTDKSYYAAPMTEQGIYYVYYQTDTHYKKLKFTRPEQLPMAFGEYAAYKTGNDAENNTFLADYFRYLTESSLAQGLPNYFDGNSAMQFGNLFANYCDPEIRADMQRLSPQLLKQVEQILGVDRSGRRPEEADYVEMTEEERKLSGGSGPASDEKKEERVGPAAESVLSRKKEES